LVKKYIQVLEDDKQQLMMEEIGWDNGALIGNRLMYLQKKKQVLITKNLLKLAESSSMVKILPTQNNKNGKMKSISFIIIRFLITIISWMQTREKR
jgi:hypothetical protein